MPSSTQINNELYRATPFSVLGQEKCAQLLHLMAAHGDNAIVLVNGSLKWARVENPDSTT